VAELKKEHNYFGARRVHVDGQRASVEISSSRKNDHHHKTDLLSLNRGDNEAFFSFWEKELVPLLSLSHLEAFPLSLLQPSPSPSTPYLRAGYFMKSSKALYPHWHKILGLFLL